MKTIGSIDPVKLSALMGATLEAHNHAKEITAPVAEDLKAAAKNLGLNVKAFNLCRSVARMDPVARRHFLDAFDEYRLMLKLDASDQADLFEAQKVDHGQVTA